MTASLRPRARTVLAAAGAATVLAAAAAGCSEPAPVIPRGAWSIVFIDTGLDCQIAGHNRALGEVSADKRQTLVEDGAEEASNITEVICTVIDNDGSFSISGSEYHTSGIPLSLTISVPEMSASASKDQPAKGTVSYLSQDTATTFSSTECNFYFLDGTGQGAEAGNVWLTFECPTIAAAQDNVCQIQVGYVAFEQCSTTN